MPVIKTACKCYTCKTPLNVGDFAKYKERLAQDNGHMQKNRSLGYVVVCADEVACYGRLGQVYAAKEQAHKQKEAQEVINLMRTLQPEELIQSMIANFATMGIEVK